jgi:hypothetical protein
MSLNMHPYPKHRLEEVHRSDIEARLAHEEPASVSRGGIELPKAHQCGGSLRAGHRASGREARSAGDPGSLPPHADNLGHSPQSSHRPEAYNHIVISRIVYNNLCMPQNIHHAAHAGAHRLLRELLLEEVLERLAVLGELLDALVQLVEGHLVLEERPAELGLVVDERDLVDRRRRCCRAVSVRTEKRRRRRRAPSLASRSLGTGSVEFLSSSSSAGAIVRKSTPASARISPALRKLAPMTIVL